jgi:lipopolysaccharide transport system permease protein
MRDSFELTIKPRSGWQPINVAEISHYRELLGFLIWRDIKIRYRQTLLGGLWAIIQPLIAMLIFTVVFNRFAGVRSDGPPYPLFAYAGLAPWFFFTNSVSQSSTSLVSHQHLVSKIYFPRIFIPLGAIGVFLIDLLLSISLCVGLMMHYHWPFTRNLLLLPLFILGCFLTAGGAGLILSALYVNFRDVKYAVPFLIQMGLFVTPVIYPALYIPARWQPLMGLNPMAGIVIGFRRALLGSPASWTTMTISLVASVLLFLAGLFIFRRMELRFADVI